MSRESAILPDQELLARLVAFNTAAPHDNLEIAGFICDYLDRPGIRSERNPSPEGDQVNLVFSAGPEVDPESRSGLTLCGHVDVVPADEPEWHSDPFELTEIGDTMVGRGTADMKGFVALAINAVAEAGSRRLRHPLALVLTYDEEVGTLGARHFVATWPPERPLPRRMVVGEPTSLEAVRLHKGFTGLRIVVPGRSAHSGYPHLGKNAIEPAARAVTALADLRRALESEPCPNTEHFAEVPHVAFNIGRIRGGTADNIVPDRCEIGIAFRPLPGMESRPIVERARAAVAAVLGGDHVFEAVHEAPPMLLGADSDLYLDLCRILGQSETVSASYATDAGWLQQGGFECLLWGPGTIEVAHRPNESMPKDEYRRAGQILGRVVEHFCGPSP
ncbi:MAG: acetylornithine deacetylase [Thermoanaerobaculia bacterium]